ncbi:hypothetical protein [Vibrio sp. WXL103]|uniref:hypothetical protein n=1 Tax=unclassified Vibrio TaxID=2614977 RepID=UPI003EC86EE9
MKIAAKITTALLVIGVGAAIYMSADEQSAKRNTVEVRGVSGSEKLPFFRDEETTDLLAKQQVSARVESAGSREIANYDLANYDFAFPAGSPAAQKIREEHNIRNAINAFHSPMVIASWEPIAEVLINNGIVEKKPAGYYALDMNKLFELIISRTRWNELEDSEAFPVNKSILVTTTDVSRSNSAAMYLSLASYILNDSQVVQNRGQADKQLDELKALFARQGFTEQSSAIPFQSYLNMGPGAVSMLMMYESQFIEEMVKPNSALTDDMVLLYPEPTIFSRHVFLPLSPEGERLGQALVDDEDIQRMAVRYGMRPQNVALFREFIAENDVTIPSQLFNVIEPPTFELLEYMIDSVVGTPTH